MTWPIAKLADIATFKTGRLDSNAAVPSGRFPFFTCSPQTLSIDTFAFDTTAILLAGNNANGNFPIKFFRGKFNCYQRTYVIEQRNDDEIDLRFLFYALKLQLERLQMMSIGATTKFLTKGILDNLKVPHPHISVQRKIAETLSAYDDLIENNLQRIRLLEEMAQLTYQEWFVRLRYPDHEATTTPDMSGVPFGWGRVALSELGQYLNGYAFKPADLGTNGMPIIKIKEIKNGVVQSTPRNSGKNIPNKYITRPGDIIFSWSASLDVVIWTEETGLINQHLFKVTPNNHISRAFLYLALKDSLKVFDGLTTGATMKHIKRKELDFVEVLVPGRALMDRFSGHVEPMIDCVLNLHNQNRLLREARDILLPRLMNGTIDPDEYAPDKMLEDAA